MDERRALIRLLEHDGERLAGTRDLLIKDVLDVGGRAAAHRIAVLALPDPETTAALLVDSLGGMRRMDWTFGVHALVTSDERAIRRWADVVLAVVATYVEPRRKRRRR